MITRLHSTMTFAQARGQLISTMMRHCTPQELTERLLRLDPHATIPEGASVRSLASRIAWKLLPGGKGA
jgi:hypothetical protein